MSASLQVLDENARIFLIPDFVSEGEQQQLHMQHRQQQQQQRASLGCSTINTDQQTCSHTLSYTFSAL
jgi:hypothetical protein